MRLRIYPCSQRFRRTARRLPAAPTGAYRRSRLPTRAPSPAREPRPAKNVPQGRESALAFAFAFALAFLSVIPSGNLPLPLPLLLHLLNCLCCCSCFLLLPLLFALAFLSVIPSGNLLLLLHLLLLLLLLFFLSFPPGICFSPAPTRTRLPQPQRTADLPVGCSAGLPTRAPSQPTNRG